MAQKRKGKCMYEQCVLCVFVLFIYIYIIWEIKKQKNGDDIPLICHCPHPSFRYERNARRKAQDGRWTKKVLFLLFCYSPNFFLSPFVYHYAVSLHSVNIYIYHTNTIPPFLFCSYVYIILPCCLLLFLKEKKRQKICVNVYQINTTFWCYYKEDYKEMSSESHFMLRLRCLGVATICAMQSYLKFMATRRTQY